MSALSVLRNHDRRVLILVACRSFTAFGFSIVFPFLSIYMHNVMKIPMAAIGMLFFTSSVAGALGQLVGGELSDRFGRKRLLVSSLAIRASTFFLMSLAVLKDLGFFPLAALIVVGMFSGRLFEPAASAMISDVTPPARRQEAYALLRIGINFGWAIGPAMGGFLASFSYAFLFLTSGIVTVIVLFLLLARLKDSGTGTRSERTSLREMAQIVHDKIFLSYNLNSLLLFLVAGQLMVTLSVYAVDWVGISKIQLGYLFTLNGLMVVFLQFPCVALLKRFRMSRVMALGSLLYAFGYFSAAFATGFGCLIASMIVVTLGEILVSPASLALVANMSSPEKYGRYMGVYGLFDSLGHSLGPLVGGLAMEGSRGQPFVVWGVIGVVGVAASIGFLAIGKRLSPAIDHPRMEMTPVSVPIGTPTDA
ncbi:MAG: MFS transporter [Candidatus Eisenbacteria bacterium]|nr:MFS transporter [Candidatus Eisenbacteria bacterium]